VPVGSQAGVGRDGRCHGVALVRTMVHALAEGLPLQVLRLKRLQLGDAALEPLFRLLQAEKQRCLSSGGSLLVSSGFCLEELDLSGNPLNPALVESTNETLRLLSCIRNSPKVDNHSQAEGDFAPPCTASHAPGCSADLVKRKLSRKCRANSEPILGIPENSFLHEDIIFDAISDDGMNDAKDGCLGHVRAEQDSEVLSHVREAFLLRRVQDKRQFRREAAMLAHRHPQRKQPAAGPCCEDASSVKLEAWEEAQLAISGALGMTAGQSLVRQALLQEINGFDQSRVDNKPTCPNLSQGSYCPDIPAGEPEAPLNSEMSRCREGDADRDPAPLGPPIQPHLPQRAVGRQTLSAWGPPRTAAMDGPLEVDPTLSFTIYGY